MGDRRTPPWFARSRGSRDNSCLGTNDYEAFVYPVGVAWVRKVPTHSLWIFYSFERDELDVRWLRATEPHPAEPT